MSVEATSIAGLHVVRGGQHDDERGFFRQTYRHAELAAALGRQPSFAQANHARSRAGVLRGFHAEGWDKLVYVARGTALCAVADVRQGSPTFGRVATFLLGDPPGERLSLLVEAGLANAYCALTEVDYLYEVTAEWDPAVPRITVAWDDPDLAVGWPVDDPILSCADRAGVTLRELADRHGPAT